MASEFKNPFEQTAALVIANVDHFQYHNAADCVQCRTMMQLQKQMVDEAKDKLDDDDVLFLEEIKKRLPVPTDNRGTIVIGSEDGHEKAQMMTIDDGEDEETNLTPLIDAFLPHIDKLACPELGCLWQFESRDKLNRHLFRGHGVSPYQCMVSTCQRMFERRSLLTKHIRSVHADVKEWNCPKCVARHTKYYQCLLHMIKCHELNRFKCPLTDCTFKSIYRNEMLKHIFQKDHYLEQNHCHSMACGPVSKRVHNHKSQLYRYLCKWPKCAFGSPDRVAVLHHIHTKHFNSRDKADIAIECVNKDANPDKFIVTVAGTLKSFHCHQPQCAFVANSKLKLERHQGHHGLRRHACRFAGCGKLFQNSANRWAHEKIHLCLKPYRCKWANCEYEANQAGAVIGHIRVKHLQLPRTVKAQVQLNIKSDVDPRDYLEIVQRKPNALQTFVTMSTKKSN